MTTDDTALEAWGTRQDAAAFHEIVSRYVDMVYGTCWRVLRNAADAEEVTQECFAALSQAKRAPIGYLGPWLHRVALNLSHKRQRSESRRVQREASYAAEFAGAVEMNWDDLHEQVDEALDALPEKLRAPLVAHFLHRQTHGAIAETLGLPRQTVTNRIHRGVEEVRKTLKKRGVLVTSAVLLFFLREGTAQAAPAHLVSALGKGAIAGKLPGAIDTALLPAAATTAKFMVVKWLAVMMLSAAVVGSGVWAYRTFGPAPTTSVAGQPPLPLQPGTVTPSAPATGPSAAPYGPVSAQGESDATEDTVVRGYVLHRSR